MQEAIDEPGRVVWAGVPHNYTIAEGRESGTDE